MCDRVWSTFQARRSDGSLVKLRIQDLLENRFDDALELFVKYFVNEETLLKAAVACVLQLPQLQELWVHIGTGKNHQFFSCHAIAASLGVPRNPKAIAEYRSLLTESMKDPAFHNVICCEAEEENKIGQIVGVSSMALVTVGLNVSSFKKIKLETEEMQIYMKLDEASNLHEHMEDLHIFNFYDDIGMVVHPQFRKLGIAMEFAKARRLACMANNVAATGGMTTCIGTEKIAKKENWDTVLKVNLEELGQQHGVTFEDGAVSKLVIWKNPQFKQDDISK